ncbi:MAG: hypothetical protein ACOYLQ_18195 [Hyphomicrobiaceae bacterium]
MQDPDEAANGRSLDRFGRSALGHVAQPTAIDTTTLLALARNLAQTGESSAPASRPNVHSSATRPAASSPAPAAEPDLPVFDTAMTDRLVAALSGSIAPATQEEPQPTSALEPVVLAHDTERLPTTLSRPGRTETPPGREAVWPSAVMALALGGAVIIGGFLVVGDPRQHKRPTFQHAEASVAPIIWAVGQEEGEFHAVPRLQSGPSTISRQERDALALAQTLIAVGNLETAREILMRAADDGGSEAQFALAETYDPNVLAAWGMPEAAPDAPRARNLYLAALALGQDRARRRLQALE